MSFEDKSLQCADCGKPSPSQQVNRNFSSRKDTQTSLSAVPACRQNRKTARFGNSGFGAAAGRCFLQRVPNAAKRQRSRSNLAATGRILQ
jgi:hypothetical protein